MTRTHGKELPLRNHTERVLNDYYVTSTAIVRRGSTTVLRVEEPLFRTVLDYSAGNQTWAATILGITHHARARNCANWVSLTRASRR
jgi:DNA-binding protein Fis